MTKLRDKFWIWGQSPNAHHETGNNYYNLPGSNIMSPLEGAMYLGVNNCCRVVINNHPSPPFDQYSMALTSMREVVWSVLGASGSNGDGLDLDEVLRQSEMFPNITGGVLDDFFTEEDSTPRMTLDELRYIRTKLQNNKRPLTLWMVLYDYQLSSPVQQYLDECDVITFWTWKGRELRNLDKNFDIFKNVTHKKRRLAGCYMWDYGDCKPLSRDDMKYQCEKYYKWLKRGDIEGIIFCSNCITGLGLDTVEWTRNWIKEIGDEKI
jgi:hypothetical protein